MLTMQVGEEIPPEILDVVQSSLDDVEMGGEPMLLEEARRLLQHFYRTVQRCPEEFRRGKAFEAIRILDRAMAKKGVTLGQLGTSRKGIFSEVMKIVRA